MKIPWRPLRKPVGRHAGAWPLTATQWLLGLSAFSLIAQWLLRHLAPAEEGPVHSALALSLHGLAAGCVWQPVSHLFLSSGPWIDFTALVALYLAGNNLEFIIGRRHLWQLYFLAGILGGFAQLAYNAATAAHAPDLVGPTAAVMGVLLALTSVMPNLEVAPLLGVPLPFWLKIKHCALVAVVACVTLALVDWQGAFAQQQAARCLIGCLTGCVYMHRLGFGRRTHAPAATPENEPMLQIPVFSQAADPGMAVAEAALPRFTERERRMTPRQYISEQIDPILDKISLHGIGCLTPAERRVLEKGRDKISQRDT